MANPDLALRMRELFGELQGLDPAQELDLLDRRLEHESDAEFALQIKITKARLLADLGREGEALILLVECSRSPHGCESAAYFAAEILVQDQRYLEAECFLEQAELQIAQSKSGYYRDCILLLHAYCAAKLCKRDLARTLLATIEDREEELIWLRTRPAVSVRIVEELIADPSPPQQSCTGARSTSLRR